MLLACLIPAVTRAGVYAASDTLRSSLSILELKAMAPILPALVIGNYYACRRLHSMLFLDGRLIAVWVVAIKVSTWVHYNYISDDYMTLTVGNLYAKGGAIYIGLFAIGTIFACWRRENGSRLPTECTIKCKTFKKNVFTRRKWFFPVRAFLLRIWR